MNATTQIRATIAELRAQADRLERALAELEGTGSPQHPVFDPEKDTPPVTPLVDGDLAQRNWCCLMLWGQLVALNVRGGRGATQAESIEIAKRAGYRDGRAWNNWTGWKKDEAGGRWATAVGLEHLRHYFETVEMTMPEDLRTASVSDG